MTNTRPRGPGEVSRELGDDGHEHWTWQCSKESGGCGYASPWYVRTEAVAQAGLDAHRERCRYSQTASKGT